MFSYDNDLKFFFPTFFQIKVAAKITCCSQVQIPIAATIRTIKVGKIIFRSLFIFLEMFCYDNDLTFFSPTFCQFKVAAKRTCCSQVRIPIAATITTIKVVKIFLRSLFVFFGIVKL